MLFVACFSLAYLLYDGISSGIMPHVHSCYLLTVSTLIVITIAIVICWYDNCNRRFVIYKMHALENLHYNINYCRSFTFSSCFSTMLTTSSTLRWKVVNFAVWTKFMSLTSPKLCWLQVCYCSEISKVKLGRKCWAFVS